MDRLKRMFPTLAQLEPVKWMMLPTTIMVWWALIYCIVGHMVRDFTWG